MDDITQLEIYPYLLREQERTKQARQMQRDYLFDQINAKPKVPEVTVRTVPGLTIDLEPKKPTILERILACVPG